jgi:hypothetical protein
VSTNLYPNRNFPYRFFGSSWACREKAAEKTKTIIVRASTIFFLFILSLLFQKNLAQIGTMYRGMADGAVGGVRIETGMKGRGHNVAAETEIGNALMGQHVPVGGAVDLMTGPASLDSRGSVFIQKRPTLVCMAFQTRFLFESSQTHHG